MLRPPLGVSVDHEPLGRRAALAEDVDDVDADAASRARSRARPPDSAPLCADPSNRATGPPGRPVSKRCSPSQVARTVIVGLGPAWGTMVGCGCSDMGWPPPRDCCKLRRGASAWRRAIRLRGVTTPPRSPAAVMEPYARHVLVCVGGFCSPNREGRALYAPLARLLEREGLLFGPRRVKRGETPCLGVCAGGPIVVVYPEGVWYARRHPGAARAHRRRASARRPRGGGGGVSPAERRLTDQRSRRTRRSSSSLQRPQDPRPDVRRGEAEEMLARDLVGTEKLGEPHRALCACCSALHAVTKLPPERSPPRTLGCTWSTVSSSGSNRSPQ